MKLTCYIIDDEKHSVEAITYYIERTPNLNLIGSNMNPLLALEEIRTGKRPDVVFLDVEMPELSGIDVMDLLDPSITIVFTTSHSIYALKAFQKDALDFLLKPFSFEMFLKCVNKVRSMIQPSRETQQIQHQQIFINPGIKGKIVQIELANITHIEAIEHSVLIHLLTEAISTHVSIKKIQEKLPVSNFIRVHRAFIINIAHVKAIEANFIVLKSGTKVPLGNVYRYELMSKIQKP